MAHYGKNQPLWPDAKKQVYPETKENKLLFFLDFFIKIKSAKLTKSG